MTRCAPPSRATGVGRASPSSTPWPRRWSASSTPRMTDRPPGAAVPPTAGAYSRFTRAVAEAELTRFLKADLNADRFSWSRRRGRHRRGRTLRRQARADHQRPDLTAAEAVARYKGLADIERGFRVLKSDIEIAPVHHRLPDRIRAHALICFLALVLYRVMRMRLKAKGHSASPRTALDLLARIQKHTAQCGSAPSTAPAKPPRSNSIAHSDAFGRLFRQLIRSVIPGYPVTLSGGGLTLLGSPGGLRLLFRTEQAAIKMTMRKSDAAASRRRCRPGSQRDEPWCRAEHRQ